MIIEKWYPVTHDLGAINSPLDQAVEGLRSWHRELDIDYERREIVTSLQGAFETLLPLSISKMRRLFVATNSDWTMCFQNGISGSDPFPAMSMLAQRLKVLAMRVCSTWPNMLHPANIWEVYAPPELGGDQPLGYRRSIACANDGGHWIFETNGEPFPFEKLEVYNARLKRDRFSRELLNKYLDYFNLHPFDDSFYRVNEDKPAVLLQRLTRTWDAAEYSLEEVVAGKPWERN